MKKITKIILLLLILFSFIGKVSAEGNIEIVNVYKDNVKGTTEEIDTPSFKGLNVAFNVRFKNKNDSIKYRITLKNKTNKDYKISDEIESFQPSKYIKYEYEFDNNEKIVAKGTEKVLYVTLTYNNELPKPEIVKDNEQVKKKEEATVKEQEQLPEIEDSSSFEELAKVYSENNKLVINLDPKDDNPNTNSSFKISAIVGLSIISIGACIILFKRNKKIVCLLLTIGLISYPLSTLALERESLIVNTRVEIVPEREINFYIRDLTASPAYTFVVTARNGDTWLDWIDSKYNNYPDPVDYYDLRHVYYEFTNPNNNQRINPSDKIEKEHIYYFYQDFPALEKEVEEVR